MFKERSYQKEMLDEPDIPQELLFRNLQELEIINTWLGGHSVSLKGIKKVVTDTSKTYNIIDIGSGGGDSVKAIANWAKEKRYNINLTGIDLKQDCIDYSQQNCSHLKEVAFACDDFRNAFTKGDKVDIVHASLFCHHFKENELIGFIQMCSYHKSIFVINDLERNPIAYHAIKWITRLFSKSILVKNDAPLSVLRGFKRSEWKAIIEMAGVKKYTVTNKWAFRHLIILYPND